MQDFQHKKILLGVCGGIAAYKSVYLVRELVRLGAEVRIVMTAAAQQFITPMTFQAVSGNAVRCELFDAEAERAMGHIELARWADYLLVAPATANCLAKMAHGVADDLLSTLYLVATIPVIICPAMNHSMWAHPSTQANYELLKKRNITFVGPNEGEQACGEYGFGRVSEADEVIDALRLLEAKTLLQGQKVMITAGPTREALDPVRYLTNHSSGKMGYALAKAAQIAGAEVTLISGPTKLPIPSGIQFYAVESADQMHAAVMENLAQNMIFIGAAAVADYRPEEKSSQKIKKQSSEINLKLTPNIDILAKVAATKKAKFVVGFAAETQNVLQNAQEKLQKKSLDMIIANQVGATLGFETDDNQVTILTRNEQLELPQDHKIRLAGKIIAILAAKLQDAKQSR